MNDLTLINESTVDESQIDSLGHMNVRYYVSRASDANESLLSQIGASASQGQIMRRVDTYNRFHREQFAGATLHTLGGLIPSGHPRSEEKKGISGYYEIRNADSGDLAASFILTSKLVDLQSDEVLTLPDIDSDALAQLTISVPDRGQPRSLSLAQPRHVSFAELESSIPSDTAPGSMNGRREGIVLPEDCNKHGKLMENLDPMFVLFRPQPGDEKKAMGPPILRDEQGRRYSWAMMEIRSINYKRPNAGDVIVSMSADVKLGEKWRHTRRWLFSKESGELFGISDHAALCMDLDARRAIPIPADIRQTMQKAALEEFL